MKDVPEMQAENSAPLLRRRDVRLGIFLWLLFCVAAVILRGVRWDEQYEFAQVINGAVAYPPEHPYVYCTWNALNFQIYLTALVHRLMPNAAIVCGFRNALYLAMTTIPVFLLGAALSGRAIWGHAGVALALMGAHEAFDACYQMWAWPCYASTGHVGMGYSLLIVALLIGGCRKSGFFLLGLMPCVHIGQMPIPLAFTTLFVALQFRDNRLAINMRRLRAPLVCGAVGLAICAGVFAARHAVEVPLPVSGPYVSAADPHAVWAGYVAQDGLRSLPNRPTKYTNSFLLLGLATLLLVHAATREWRETRETAWGGAGIYAALCACAVWGVMAMHYALGAAIPYVFLAWMPYRMANHAAVLIVAALPALVARRYAAGAYAVGAVMLFAVLRPAVQVLQPEIHARYFAEGEAVLFFLCGAAAASLFDGKRAWLALYAAAFAIVAMTHQFGFACMAAGAAFIAVSQRVMQKREPSRAMNRWAGACIAAALLVMVAVQWQHRDHLRASDFERQLTQRLAEDGQPDALLLAPPMQYTLQAKTGHPIMADTCLAPWIPYLPSIGPAIQKIHLDWYGQRWDAGPGIDDWGKLWRDRKVQDWQALGTQYGLRYVISPNHVPLELPVMIKGKRESLYRIPKL